MTKQQQQPKQPTHALTVPLCSQFSSALPLFVLGDKVVSRREFWQMVADRVAYLREKPTSQYALWTDNAPVFLAWLLAVVCVDKTLILPPHQPFLDALLSDDNDIVLLDDGISVATSTLDSDTLLQALSLALAQTIDNKAIIFYTSGSTGTPKAIKRTLGELIAESLTLLERFPVLQEAMVYRSVSHQHLYGLTFGLFVPLVGRGVAYLTQMSSPETLGNISQTGGQAHRVSVLVSSPALLKRCAGVFDFAVSVIISAGGVLSRTASVQYQADVIEIFGSSETGVVAWRDGKADAPFSPFSDMNITLSDTGTLVITSPRANDNTPLITQDQGELVGAGFILQGRSDRIIKLEEKRLSLDAIEDALHSLADVADCHVLSVAHGERVFLSAVVVLDDNAQHLLDTDGKKMMVHRLKTALRQHLEPIALPKHWRFVRQILRNPQGKIDKLQMTALFDNSTPHSTPSPQADRYPPKTLIRQSADSLSLSLEFVPSLVCFQGHFDGFPIYPGVGQVGFLVRFCQDAWTDLAWCMALEQIKFSELIRPHDRIMLSLERSAHKVSFRLSKDDKAVATGRLVFALTADKGNMDNGMDNTNSNSTNKDKS